MKVNPRYFALAILGMIVLLVLARRFAPFGMVFFWIGTFLLLTPVLGMKWERAIIGGTIASILWFTAARFGF